MNSLIWALLLVVIVGPGVLAGTIAIGIRSIGGCAKLIYESIEEIDPKQVEAIKATGGSRAQQMVYGILPQVLPTIAELVYSAGILTFVALPSGIVGGGYWHSIECLN